MITKEQRELLQELIARGGNCVNLGRHIEARYPDLHQTILDSTTFLSAVKFNERVYCILNGINQPQLNAIGKPAEFINLFAGYIMRERTAIANKKKQQKDAERAEKLANTPPKKTKLEKWLIRNQSMNAHLYNDPSLVEGYDYIVCPHSKARMSLIGKPYITNTLNMSVEEYDTLYPGTVKNSPRRKDNISQGLKEIDPESGLTKIQLAVQKAIITLSAIGEDGLRGYDRLGAKSKATHMANIDEFGRNGYSQLASKAIIKGNQTKVKNGQITSFEDRDEVSRYYTVVLYVTGKFKKKVSKGYKLDLAGTPDAYHIDHNYSIMQGYLDKVSPIVIGDIANLRLLTWQDNLSKGSRSDIELSDLLQKTLYTPQQSELEYHRIMTLIREDIANEIPPNGAFLLERLYNAGKLRITEQNPDEVILVKPNKTKD